MQAQLVASVQHSLSMYLYDNAKFLWRTPGRGISLRGAAGISPTAIACMQPAFGYTQWILLD